MAGRIVVGTDGSQASGRTLAWAVAEAAAREAVLQSVIVRQGPHGHGEPGHGPVDEGQPAMGAGKRPAQVLAEAAGEASATVTEPLVAHGDPAQVLCERSAGADLLVVGSRCHAGLRGLTLGSVSTKCAHRSRCPVVIVRGGTPGRDDRLIRRILVGFDGSQESRKALAWAVDEAALRGASVEALDVWRDPYGGEMSLEFDMEHFRDDRQILLERAQDRLAATVAEAVAHHPGLEVAPVLLQGDDPARTLCERSADADLLVVGSRGHGGLTRLLLGSVSTTCARHSKCPVAIIPKAGRADG